MRLFILLTALTALSSPVFAQVNLNRTVAANAESRVYWAGSWRDRHGICSNAFRQPPNLDVQVPPQHGTLRMAPEADTPKRSGCQNPIYGTAIYYRPAPGWVGQDQFIIIYTVDPMATNVLGPHGQIAINLTAR